MFRYLHSLLQLARTLKGTIALGISSFLLIVGITMAKATAQSPSTMQLTPSAAAHIQALIREKLSRTPTQQKISSALLYTIKVRRKDNLFQQVPSLNTFVKVDAENKVRVDIQTNVLITSKLLQKIQARGVKILSAFPEYNAIQVLIPLTQVESLAELSEVKSVNPYIKPIASNSTMADEAKPPTNKPPQANQDVAHREQARKPTSTVSQIAMFPGVPIPNAGQVVSEGDIAHGAAIARQKYQVDGTGVKIGVLSTSYNNLGGAATDISNGELPPDGVTLVGSGDEPSGGDDEGRAMLQIIHDLAPGAKLYFAKGLGSQADFANNVRALWKAGCNIIADDIYYYADPVFQDGIIAKAINDVTADGALYFSSAGNFGNKKDGTSGVWEGNFVDGGLAPLGLPGRVHSFGTSIFNRLTTNSGKITLQWSDPLGKSANDYDLYVLSADGTKVVAASTNVQSGKANPFEIVNPQAANSRVIIVQHSGQSRFLNLNTFLNGTRQSVLEINTSHAIYGHSVAVNAYSVAAVNAQNRTTLFTGGAANPVEVFTSDGPRRIYYTADGTPTSPGDFLNGGEVVRLKPSIAAADGVKTTVPGFQPFFGTSAAAPHAAAVAALLKSFRPHMSSKVIRQILIKTTLDVEAPGFDTNSGFGIVMANQALDWAAKLP